MELFEVDENDYTCRLNRQWIYLIPEFADILRRDKGGSGDRGGHRKLWARKRFAFIFFYVDFKSPIYGWDDGERFTESLRYTGLDKEDIKADYMQDAIRVYTDLQFQAARSLKTLKAVNNGLSQLDDYFENIDFKAIDKQGKVMYTASDYVKNISMLNKAYDELNAFERRVMAELTKSGGIRGSATKGDREVSRGASAGTASVWEELGDQSAKSPQWMELSTGTEFKDDL